MTGKKSTLDDQRFDYDKWAEPYVVDLMRDAIKAEGLTVSEAAERLGINRVNLSKILGGRPISLAMARKFGETFNVSAYAIARAQFEYDFADIMGVNGPSAER